MKKFLLSLAAILCIATSAMAKGQKVDAASSTIDNPMTVAEALAAASADGPKGVFVKGIVTKVTTSWSSQYKNVSFTIADTEGGTETIEAFRSVWGEGVTPTADNNPQVGATVVISGDLTVFNGKKEIAKGNKIVKYTAPQGGSTPTPDVPESSIDNPLTVAKALEICGDNPAGVYVKGYVTAVTTTWSEQYKNVSFNIADTKDGSDVLLVFRAKWGADVTPTANNDPEVGALVVISGDLKIYNGTKEFNSGCQIVKYTAPEGGDTPGPGPDPDPVGPTGEKATYNFTDITKLDPAYDPEEAEADGTTGNVMFKTNDVVFKAGPVTLVGEGTGNNRLYYSSSAKAWSYRIYRNTTVTIAATGETTLNAVVFETATANYATALGNAKFSVGTYDKSSKTLSLPEGTKSVVITPSATTGFNAINVYYNDPAGVNDIVAEDSNAPVEYYNLQGVRVANPENGLYIRVQGKKATKVLVK